jgi:hypothetical protein
MIKLAHREADDFIFTMILDAAPDPGCSGSGLTTLKGEFNDYCHER